MCPIKYCLNLHHFSLQENFFQEYDIKPFFWIFLLEKVCPHFNGYNKMNFSYTRIVFSPFSVSDIFEIPYTLDITSLISLSWKKYVNVYLGEKFYWTNVCTFKVEMDWNTFLLIL